MDSLNLHKGYDKVVDHDQPPPPTHTAPRNRLRLIAISLTVILTVAICSLIVALVHETITEEREVDSIAAVCSVTPYPASCSAALSNNSLSEPDPERILYLSLRAAVSELRNLTPLPKALILKANDEGAESALRDCDDLFGDALSRLSESARAAEGGGVKGGGDLNTWISAAMSDQETCVDGLEEMGSTVAGEVRARAQRSKEYMSNSLAILANMNALLEKFH